MNRWKNNTNIDMSTDYKNVGNKLMLKLIIKRRRKFSYKYPLCLHTLIFKKIKILNAI